MSNFWGAVHDPTGIAATQGKAARDPQQGQNPRQTVRGILRRAAIRKPERRHDADSGLQCDANRSGDTAQTGTVTDADRG